MAQPEFVISFEAAWSIKSHLLAARTREQGGALGGLDDLVICAVWLPNEADDKGCAWRCSAGHQLNAVHAIEDHGLELVGTYHSHPAGNAEPSAEDIRTAEGTGAVLIVATHEAEPVARPWEWRACLPDAGKAVPVRVLTPGSLPDRLPGINLDRST